MASLGKLRLTLGLDRRYKPGRIDRHRTALTRAKATPSVHPSSDLQVRPAMSLLSRYILSEVVQVFVISLLAVMTMVFILCGVGKEAYNNGLTLWAILRLMPYLLPTALLFGVPAALLFAVTTVFGRMSAGGEIIALEAPESARERC